MRRFTAALLAGSMLCVPSVAFADEDKEEGWDVEAPRGATIEQVPIRTDEATWMDVDVSPDGRTLAIGSFAQAGEVALVDGRTLAPSEFDDQAARSEDPACEPPFTACLGPTDDNVLDLCVDADAAVVHVHFPAGLFSDDAGHPSAAAELMLP